MTFIVFSCFSLVIFFSSDVANHVLSPLADLPSVIPLTPAKTPPIRESGSEEPKKGTDII